MSPLLPRLLSTEIERALEVHGIVLVEGPRACGKTTLLRMAREADTLDAIVDLSDPTVRSAASADPVGFVEALPPRVGIDEAQLVPDLVLAVKRCVDRPQGWGPAVITGSAPVGRNELGGSPPLAGRATRRSLGTLTIRERQGLAIPVLGALLTAASGVPVTPLDKSTYSGLARSSGFPAARTLAGADLAEWIDDNYVDAVLPQSLAESGRAINPAPLTRVLRHLCSATGSELNVASLARDLDVNRATATQHLDLLEGLHLIHLVPGWRTNSAKRAVSRPKLHAVDGGLAHWAIGPMPTDQQAGAMIESLVVREILGQLQAMPRAPSLFHWRERSTEVDLVLVDHDRATLIEIKSTRSIPRNATRGFEAFERAHPKLDCRGIVFYLGDETAPLGTKHSAVPVSALWSTD